MLRWIASPFIGALLIAPLGFGATSPALVADAARVLFGILLAMSLGCLLLGVAFNRRWRVPGVA